MKHSNTELQQKQGLPLELKIIMTQQRIKSWYEHYKGDVYISFSGGKDSTVLLDIARKLYPNIKAVFIDTGLEYPEIRDFVKTFDNVEWLKPKMNFKKVLEHYGYPVVSKEQSQYIQQYRNAKSEKTKETRLKGNKYGRGKISDKWKYLINAPFKISDQCCNVMKKNPAKEFEKLTGLKPIIATMTEESELRKSQWLQIGCNAFDATRPTSKPMSFWTEQDVLKYIKDNNLPIAKVYGDIIQTGLFDYELETTGCKRTGCVFCLYGLQNEERGNTRFDRLNKTHPQLYDYCMNKLKLKEIIDYLNL